MSALKPFCANTLPPAASIPLLETRIAMVLDSTHCLLADGRQASRALSCLVALQAGDLVLTAQSESGCHVLHVLQRSSADNPVALCTPGEGEMLLRGRSLRMHALETLALTSGGDTDVTAVNGGLSLNARNLFMNISDSLVQQSRHFIGKAGQYLLDVRHLLKLHSQDALITAERDIKADAERISMG